MAKIIYDDWNEKDFNESDFISVADLEENYISKDDLEEGYISKDDLEENYVSKEKYDQKKKQAKEAFKKQDLATKNAVAMKEWELAKEIEDKIRFTTKHWFDEIPEEIKSVKQEHPWLTWEQCYRVADYQPPVDKNPNPWREKTDDIEKKSYSFDELAWLAEKDPVAYWIVAEKIEKGEIKQI